MAPLKRQALARRHDAPRPTARAVGSRNVYRPDGLSLPQDNQIIRGLLVGVPLGLAIWLMLALIAWWIV
jgi:hypothetical protein